MIRTGTFSLEDFMKNSNLMAKHPEIFDTDRKATTKKMLKKFEAYTKELNKLKDVDKFVDKLKKNTMHMVKKNRVLNLPIGTNTILITTFRRQMRKKMIFGFSQRMIVAKN